MPKVRMAFRTDVHVSWLKWRRGSNNYSSLPLARTACGDVVTPVDDNHCILVIYLVFRRSVDSEIIRIRSLEADH